MGVDVSFVFSVYFFIFEKGEYLAMDDNLFDFMYSRCETVHLSVWV